MYGGACHPIDLLRWFLGDVEEVHAYGRKGNLTPEYPYEDNYLINLEFVSGAIARVLAAYGLVEPPMPMMGLGLYGTKASLISDFADKQAGPGPSPCVAQRGNPSAGAAWSRCVVISDPLWGEPDIP